MALGPVGGNHANLHNLNAVPGALAAGLPCRLRLPPGCSCCAGAGAGRDPGAPAAGRAGALVRMLQVAGASWFRSGRQVVVLPAVGPAAVQRRCWLVLDFKHTFRREGAGGVRAAGGPRGSRTDAGRGAAGVLSAWPQRRRCGRLCRRVSFRENEPGLLRCPGSVRGRPGAGAADPGVGGSAWIRGFPRQAVLFPEADLQWSAKACNVFQATAAGERKRLAAGRPTPSKQSLSIGSIYRADEVAGTVVAAGISRKAICELLQDRVNLKSCSGAMEGLEEGSDWCRVLLLFENSIVCQVC